MFGKSKPSKFKLDFEKEQTADTAINLSSRYGRAATTIATAESFHKKQDRTDPISHILEAVEKKENYYGQTFEDNKPFTIPQDEITHSIFVGSTGTGKGVILQNRVFQSIKEKKGCIIVDPKNDHFLPQICIETLEKFGRKDDFEMCFFPNFWSYKSITEDDTYLEMANKMIDMFNLQPSSNPGVDHFRKLSRTILKRVLKMFFVDLTFKKHIRKDFLDIKKHIILLKTDLEKMKLYELEISKNRPNAELLEKFSKRYFDPQILDELYFNKSDVDSLESLVINFDEVTEGMTFTETLDIKEALYNGKVVYIRVDMNSISSLSFVKLLIVDIIQKAKKRTANTDIYLDELSFYGTSTLAGALATTRSMGLNFSMFLQAISQLNEEIRDDILENSNQKIFYKSSNLTTLKYIEEVGGMEAISKISNKDGTVSYSQDFEKYLNTTKIRALPRTSVAIVISEYLAKPQIIQTNFIATKKLFDWSVYFNKKVDLSADKNIKVDLKEDKKKLEKYRVFLKENKSLLENSDLFGVVLGSESI